MDVLPSTGAKTPQALPSYAAAGWQKRIPSLFF
jgi:hypothetical protein